MSAARLHLEAIVTTPALIPLALVLFLVPAMARAYEEPKHEIVDRHQEVELRRYAPHLVVETVVAGEFDDARTQAFRRLFRYISGANRARAEISMTVPVTTTDAGGGEQLAMTAPVTSAGAGGGQVMRFMLPSSFTAETAPEPTDPTVRVVELPEQYVAALRYSGRSNQANFREQEVRLLAVLGEVDGPKRPG